MDSKQRFFSRLIAICLPLLFAFSQLNTNAQTLVWDTTIPPVLEVTTYDTISIQLSASGGPLEYFYDIFGHLPIEHANIDTETGLFTWSPTVGQGGIYQISFGAYPVPGFYPSIRQEITITIAEPALPTQWEVSDSPMTAFSDQEFRFVLPAVDPSYPLPVTYSIPELPIGAKFDPDSRVLTWTPTAEQSSSHLLWFEATDGHGRTYRGVIINVEPPPTAATLGNFWARKMSDGRVLVGWQTLVEYNHLGFQLRRSIDRGQTWVNVGGIVPATGSSGRPTEYKMEDAEAQSLNSATYELISLGLNGLPSEAPVQTKLQPQTQMSLSSSGEQLQLRITGVPGSIVTLEKTHKLGEPWVYAGSVSLDSSGIGTAHVNKTDPMNLFRVKEF